MLFNSDAFLFLFLPLTLAGWWWWRSPALRLTWITLASYVFYGWWNWRFLPLMIASTTVDYVASARIAAETDRAPRRRWLVGALSFNLGLLAFFKYYGWLAASVNSATVAMGGGAVAPILNIILPIGISFYTFNSMSYTIDVYRGLIRPAASALHYAAFVALFPHLIAGPIVRYAEIGAQLNALKRRLSADEASLGIQFFVVGLAKKVLIADQLAGPVNLFFAMPHPAGLLNSWLAALGYTFQLYFDFSGYSDMAVGLAHLMGFQFPQNFNSPYKAHNIADFWRRWHMSLSRWLRDYLFISLGGSREGRARTIRNVIVTMFLGGLWHGANWTFVAWGLYHGVLLGVHAASRGRWWAPKALWPGRVLTFMAVTVGWVLFRADSFHKAGLVLAAMVGRTGHSQILFPRLYLCWLGGAAGIAFLARNSWEMDWRSRGFSAYALAAMLVASILWLGNASPFLYFQF